MVISWTLTIFPNSYNTLSCKRSSKTRDATRTDRRVFSCPSPNQLFFCLLKGAKLPQTQHFNLQSVSLEIPLCFNLHSEKKLERNESPHLLVPSPDIQGFLRDSIFLKNIFNFGISFLFSGLALRCWQPLGEVFLWRATITIWSDPNCSWHPSSYRSPLQEPLWKLSSFVWLI